MTRRAPIAGLALIAALAAAAPGAAQTVAQTAADGLPGSLRPVAYEQRLGEQLPTAATLVDSDGQTVELGALLDGRPAILALVYYDCPMLCSLVLNGLTRSLKTLEFDPGEEFQVLVVSFDPSESPSQAAALRDTALARYNRPGTEGGWHFLTGDAPAIDALTEAVGFQYSFDEASGEFAHAAGLVVVTPSGRIARYFYGVEYPPRDLRLGLVEAADETIGNLVDQVLLYCYRYNPETGTYSAATMNLVRLGGLVTVATLGIFLTLSFRRERRLESA